MKEKDQDKQTNKLEKLNLKETKIIQETEKYSERVKKILQKIRTIRTTRTLKE